MHQSNSSLPLTTSAERVVSPDLPNLETFGYQVLAQLSHHADGERITYLAREMNTDRQVVIKEWRNLNFHQPSLDYATYRAEIERLQQLNYLNIPRYLNSFPTPTGFCIVRAYQPGVSLAELATLPPSDLQLIAASVLKILADLQHLQPIIIHQNIKPENLIVNTEGRLMVYLVDFGLHPQDSPHAIATTPGFIPPEQIFNRKLTSASDLYSLGVSLICLLTGTSTADAQHLLDDRCCPQFEHLIPPNTPPELITWLKQMVEPNQQRRYPDAISAYHAMSDPDRVSSPLRIVDVIQPNRSRAASSSYPSKSKFQWWQWLLAAGVLLGLGLLLRQLTSPDASELTPAQIAKNQEIATQAEFAASDRGKLMNEKKCVACNLNNQNFAKAELTGAVLSQSSLNRTNFSTANLTLAIFGDADLSEADLSRSNLQQAAFYGAKLLGTNLVEANLTNAKLVYAKAKGARLRKANLTNANLQFAELSQVDLTNANLTGADLTNADLTYANLHHAILTGAKLNGTILTGATMPNGSIHQ